MTPTSHLVWLDYEKNTNVLDAQNHVGGLGR
jgi:hypothetical protein